jgi:2-dehydro-3-deoxygalactonokinase
MLFVDWGTSAFRVYLLAPGGRFLNKRASARGIATVTDGDFPRAFKKEVGDWLGGGELVVFSGMITSRNGWVETPYVPVPATLADLKKGAVYRKVDWPGSAMFLPGVAAFGADADVMRGEEIQVFGAVEDDFEGVVVLPGTHSKWVAVSGGAIRDLATYLSGETWGLLMKHSIVGRLAPAEPVEDAAAFADGLARAKVAALPGDLLHDVFTARSRVLVSGMAATAIGDYLSGMLIGAEIRAGLARTGARHVVLVGEEGLVARYMTACAAFGIEARAGRPDAALEGFRKLQAVRP